VSEKSENAKNDGKIDQYTAGEALPPRHGKKFAFTGTLVQHPG
jgi:hypothetical protein